MSIIGKYKQFTIIDKIVCVLNYTGKHETQHKESFRSDVLNVLNSKFIVKKVVCYFYLLPRGKLYKDTS